MKLFQKIEHIFKFRIENNEEIPSYIQSLSEMGKLDEPKKIALFSLILSRLALVEETLVDFHNIIKDQKSQIEEFKKQNQPKEEKKLKK